MDIIIQSGIKKNLISFNEDSSRITYTYQNKSRNYNNPEEKVQAETFLKLILSFNYPEKRIRQFVPVPMGSEVKEADIIVYDDDECTKPLIVVECKKQDITELEFTQAINQAASYAYALSGTIKYIWVTSKTKDECFLIDKERQTKKSIPNIPLFGKEVQKYKYVKGGLLNDETAGNNEIKQQFFDLEQITENELTNKFKQAHQSLWAGGELNPSEAFDELDKLIFCKIWDERKDRKKGEPYDFQIIDIEKPKNATKEEIALLEEKVTNQLYKRVLALYEEGRKKDAEVFRDNIRLSAQKIRTVVSYLEGVNLSKTDLDSKGKAFETFMGSYFRGDFGQFFTPRNIVKFIVNSLPITNESKVLDSSCGSGGFLLYALDKVRQEADNIFPDRENDKDEIIRHYNHWHDFASKNLFGIEINEQIARTAKMNMIIHDDGHTNVITSDGLIKAEELVKNTGNKGFENNSFDFIITNPPFGSSIKQTERAYLHQYKFGTKDVSWLDTKNSAVQDRETQNTEVLFIEQDYNFLKEGGFLAIVIPDGILTNSTMQYVRDKIEEWFRIVAVVSLPQTAFAANGAGVKSSILFLRKWSESQSSTFQSKKKSIQEKIKADADYIKKVADWENQKKEIIKEHIGFEYSGTETNKKQIEKTQEFVEWKKSIIDEYNQKLNDLKDDLEEKYLLQKQEELLNYDIFMAIAEDIGYDATGRQTTQNDLEQIGKELEQFIKYVIDSGETIGFELSSEAGEKKNFIITKSEIEGRWDPFFYKPEFTSIFINKKNWTRLGYLIDSVCHPPEFERIYANEGFQLIRSQNVRPFGVNLEESPVFLDERAVKNRKLIFPKVGDVLIVRSGVNAGDVACIKTESNKAIIGADNLLLKTQQDKLLPEFVQVYFFTDIGRKLLDRFITGATNKHLTPFSIKRVEFPNVPKNVQEKCILIFENSLAQKKQKKLQAQELLNSIDDYLLEELGITLPKKDNSLEKRIFKVKFSEVVGGRLDPKLYSYESKILKTNIVSSKYACRKLKDFVVQNISGEWGIDEFDNMPNTEKCLVIRATEFDNDFNLNLENSRTKYRLIPKNKILKIDLKENDLLIEKSGGSEDQPVGRVAIITDEILKTGNICFSNFIQKIRVTEILPKYLFCYLKTIHNIKFTDMMQSQTNGLRNLILSDYFNQQIPFPPLEKQKEIVDHISSIRTQAKNLQQEAEQDLQDAKAEIEKMILGK